MSLTSEQIEKIKLVSEDVRTVMGTPPGWIMRGGNMVIFGCVLMLLVLAWYIQYPDTVHGNVRFAMDKQPVVIKPTERGTIKKLFVKNGQLVKKNEVLFTFAEYNSDSVNSIVTFASPGNGRVKLLNSLAGSNAEIEKDEVILSIVPFEQKAIKVIVNVPSEALGEIELGQNAIIRLDNYPAQKYGTITGSVVAISPVLQKDFYEITVKLNNLLLAYNKQPDLYIPSGGTAKIITRNKSVFWKEYLGCFDSSNKARNALLQLINIMSYGPLQNMLTATKDYFLHRDCKNNCVKG